MTDLRKAAEMALKVLESIGPMDMHPEEWAVTLALRAALEQEKKWDLIREMHNVEDKT